jgi:hypothetical protein
VLLYGCIHLLKALSDLIEGVEQIEEDEEKIAAKGSA